MIHNIKILLIFVLLVTESNANNNTIINQQLNGVDIPSPGLSNKHHAGRLLSFKMAKIIGIYKITSPSGKIYIGQSINCIDRFKHYKNKGSKKQVKLIASFGKYGIDKHKFEVIHQCEPKELDALEIYYISLFQSFNTKHGMNLRSGGGSGGALSEETKANISKTLTGKKRMPHSAKTKRKIGKGNRGKRPSAQARKNMSIAQIKIGNKPPNRWACLKTISKQLNKLA